MIQNKEYMLYKINGIPYLLPYGQGVADLRRGVRINETGAYVWDLLSEEISEEEILARCASHFQAGVDELPDLKTDIRHFLTQLKLRRILKDSSCRVLTDAPFRCLCIGGLTVSLSGPAEYFSVEFSSFATDTLPSGTADQTVELRPCLPEFHPLGQVLLRNSKLTVLRNADEYILSFPSASAPLEVRLSADGTGVLIFAAGIPSEPFVKDIFHAVRLCYLYLAQQRGLFALHSASFLYRERIWLFSGHSGAGKSTHTNLWQELWQVPLINGDLNLLDVNGPVPAVHGLPWCGTSGVFTPGVWPLGGIAFIRQAPCNTVEQLTPEEKHLLIAQHLISPAWTREQAVLTLDAAGLVYPRALVCRLCCTKDPAAAETMRRAMDTWLEHPSGGTG